MTGEEILERYVAGERDFAGVRLTTANLDAQYLSGVNLIRASLERAVSLRSHK